MSVLHRLSVINPGVAKFIFRERRLRKVLDLIESRPGSSVRELARAVSLSPTHLQRLFKQQIGINVRDLLAEHRLQNAAHLLAASDLSIKEISHRVGYEHHSSFVRAFQRRFAQAPKHYRGGGSDTPVLFVANS
jgi:AraC family L-rhamnose operon regulatory protein RhaS